MGPLTFLLSAPFVLLPPSMGRAAAAFAMQAGGLLALHEVRAMLRPGRRSGRPPMVRDRGAGDDGVDPARGALRPSGRRARADRRRARPATAPLGSGAPGCGRVRPRRGLQAVDGADRARRCSSAPRGGSGRPPGSLVGVVVASLGAVPPPAAVAGRDGVHDRRRSDRDDPPRWGWRERAPRRGAGRRAARGGAARRDRRGRGRPEAGLLLVVVVRLLLDPATAPVLRRGRPARRVPARHGLLVGDVLGVLLRTCARAWRSGVARDLCCSGLWRERSRERRRSARRRRARRRSGGRSRSPAVRAAARRPAAPHPYNRCANLRESTRSIRCPDTPSGRPPSTRRRSRTSGGRSRSRS